ncbi:MAG TPA: TlpA disulfide reductase family protein [Chitinophaga sp.]|uniref:TlpA disulfide reductase family protein n=1 Tax=Chitinophaga sp. TaxID=1869181 RepID=UPI002C8CEB82|nr:TlpA disulfide reductase family protein [Chitinophaga sp.]HVI48836.1 TlpA disulfide reductase family protein [Chitinophaga sp.]
MGPYDDDRFYLCLYDVTPSHGLFGIAVQYPVVQLKASKSAKPYLACQRTATVVPLLSRYRESSKPCLQRKMMMIKSKTMIRNRCYLLMVLLLPVAAYAARPFRVTGTLHLAEHPVWAHLYYYLSGDQLVHDSVRITDGKFTFAGELDEPVKAYLNCHYPPSVRKLFRGEFYLEPGNHAITISEEGKLTVQGSLLNDEYVQLQQELAKIGKPTKIEEIDSFCALRDPVEKDFVSRHPASFLSLELLEGFSGYTLEQQNATFAGFTPALKNSHAGKAFVAMLETLKRVQIGEVAPDFTEKDTAGIDVSLKDFRGKYVLVDFWASWCLPCSMENPNLLKAYNKYKDRNFTVLGVSLDESKSDWIMGIQRGQLPWKHISHQDPQRVSASKLYAVRFIPENFLISPEGKIIAHNLIGKGLEKLDELLK